MEIIEKFICGKKSDSELNEDKLIITHDFIGVIDGVSQKNARFFAQKKAGNLLMFVHTYFVGCDTIITVNPPQYII